MSQPASTVIVIAVVLTVIISHGGAWPGAFVGDDISEIAENSAIHTLWPPWVPMFEGTPMPHRPLPYLTFALNHAAHGIDPRGYLATNWAVHLANGALLWFVGTEILGRLAGRATTAKRAIKGSDTAFAAATLWLLHPLTTQAVGYIYQRIESMATLSILACLALFLKGLSSPNTGPWLAGSIGAAGIGMLCKETAVAAPFIIVLVDWLVASTHLNGSWRSLVHSLNTRRLFYGCLFATPLIAVMLVWLQRDRFTDFDQPLAGPLLYAANQPLVIGHYVARAFWPSPLCLDWYRTPRNDAWTLLPGVVTVVATVLLAVFLRHRMPGVALALLAFFILLAPTSSILPVNDLMVEHRMYLPLGIMCVVFCASLSHVIEASLPSRRAHVVSVTLVTALAVGLGLATWNRCRAYRSRLVMWADVVTKAPHNPRGWQTLALELWQIGQTDRALEAVSRSLTIVSKSPVSLTTRAGIFLSMGRFQDAAIDAGRAIELDPELLEARSIRAAALDHLPSTVDE